MTFIKSLNSFKFKALFFLAIFTCTSVVADTTQNPEIPTSNPSEMEIAKQRYEAAAKRILKSWDHQKDGMTNIIIAYIVASCLSGVIYNLLDKDGEAEKAGLVLKNYQNRSACYTGLLQPIVKILIDKLEENTRKNTVDKCLDILISTKDLNLEGLKAANIDIDELENKIRQFLSDVPDSICLIQVCIGALLLSIASKDCPWENKLVKFLVSGTAFSLCFYAYVIQNPIWKKWIRTLKIEKLKTLLKQAKQQAEDKKITAPGTQDQNHDIQGHTSTPAA